MYKVNIYRTRFYKRNIIKGHLLCHWFICHTASHGSHNRTNQKFDWHCRTSVEKVSQAMNVPVRNPHEILYTC